MALPPELLSEIVDEVLETMGGPRQVEPFTSRFRGYDLGDAYWVVEEVRRRREARGERVVGRKIGFTNAAAWAGYGISAPIWNYLYDRTTLDLSETSEFRLGTWPDVRMETEVAFGLAAAPEPGMTSDELLACISWVALDFEICSSIFPDWRFQVADPASTGVHVALLIGERVAVSGDRRAWLGALARFTARLSSDSGVQVDGGGGQALGSPVNAFGQLVRELARYGGEPLQAGDIVTTGTLTEAPPARVGERWEATVVGLPLKTIAVRLI